MIVAGVVAVGLFGALGLGANALSKRAASNRPETLDTFLVPRGISNAVDMQMPKPAPVVARKNPPKAADPHIARQAALRDAAEFGMIGSLNSGLGKAMPPQEPLGNDSLSQRGNMWGDSIGDSFGAGGLGLSGIGEGGGGTGEGIGLGNVGSIGHGGRAQGFGSGRGSLGRRSAGARPVKKLRTRIERLSTRGLDKEATARVLKKKRSAFTRCEPTPKPGSMLHHATMLGFRVDAAGHIVLENTDAERQAFSTDTARCVLKVLQSITFPVTGPGPASFTFNLVIANT